MGYSEQLFQFIEQASTNSLVTRDYDDSYNELTVKVSFGQGVTARIPWVSFLKEPNTTSKGIYPVYLLYKNIEKLVLAYGISEENPPNQSWNLTNPQSISEYFANNNLGRPARYGSSYVYEVYDVEDLPSEDQLDSDLDEIISIYTDNMSLNRRKINDAIEIANRVVETHHENHTRDELSGIYQSQIKPHIERYKNEFGQTPQLFLKSILKIIYEENNFSDERYGYLEENNFSDEKYSYVSNGHWGNGAIRNYVWGCIHLKDPENNELQFSRSPQLAIGIDNYAIRFGFFFGDNIAATDPIITEVKRDNELLGEILSAVNMNPNISFVSQSEISEIYHEDTRGRELTVLEINNLDDLRNSWEKSIKFYVRIEQENLDDNSFDEILNTLNYLAPIFKKICNKRSSNNIVQGETMDIVPEVISDLFLSEDEFRDYLDLLKSEKNIILQGPPGVGKTYIAKKLAHCLLNSRGNDRIEMIQFHQSYSYEDFIQGYRPDGEGGFKLETGIFYKLCEKARSDSGKTYVLIIDEINRGNLSKIFGELLMLIEADKRGEDYEVSLTYSPEEKFSVPENIFLIGTMNTADRSIAMVDYALRRRFSFITLAPQFNNKFKDELLRNEFSTEMIQKIMQKINNLNSIIREDISLGEGFQVGHSYFCPDGNGPYNNSWYDKKIKYKVEPLLKEYWFDSPEMVQSLLEDL